jgi:hypothetical protein
LLQQAFLPSDIDIEPAQVPAPFFLFHYSFAYNQTGSCTPPSISFDASFPTPRLHNNPNFWFVPHALIYNWVIPPHRLG